MIDRLLRSEDQEGLPMPGFLKKLEAWEPPNRRLSGPDAFVRVASPDGREFLFVVEAKARSTPEAVGTAILQARNHARNATQEAFHPMILVPYLSESRLNELEQEGVSGIDVCGNGVITVPDRIYVRRSGEPRRCREKRGLNDPFSGRSAMVGRMLLGRGRWNSLNELHRTIWEKGGELSLSQVSKALKALQEERLVRKVGGTILLKDPVRLLEELGRAWKMPGNAATYACNLAEGVQLAEQLSRYSLSTPMLDRSRLLHWSVTGESSAMRHAIFPHHGPLKIAVSNMLMALNAMGSKISKAVTPGFADIMFIETSEGGYYFDNHVDSEGKRWASLLQTWLELQAGDARQRETAEDLKKQLVGQLKDVHDIR